MTEKLTNLDIETAMAMRRVEFEKIPKSERFGKMLLEIVRLTVRLSETVAELSEERMKR